FNTEVGSGATSERPRGAFVKVIKPNSPAEFAGLRYGDVILEFDGVRVDNDEHLVQLVGLSRVGNPIDLLVLRDSQIVRIQVELVGIPGIN
ncbi:MAG: PDZ domain-containing protein, partial [Pirellulaceae bacterium]